MKTLRSAFWASRFPEMFMAGFCFYVGAKAVDRHAEWFYRGYAGPVVGFAVVAGLSFAALGYALGAPGRDTERPEG